MNCYLRKRPQRLGQVKFFRGTKKEKTQTKNKRKKKKKKRKEKKTIDDQNGGEGTRGRSQGAVLRPRGGSDGRREGKGGTLAGAFI